MALTDSAMEAAISAAFKEVWEGEKHTPLPDIGLDDRKLLFEGIAKGILNYLKDNQAQIFRSITLKDAYGHSHNYSIVSTDINYTKVT